MRKIFLALSVAVTLFAFAAQSAQAVVLTGSDHPGYISAAISVAQTGTDGLEVAVSNTSAVNSYLTSLAFQMAAGLNLTFEGAFHADGTTPFVYVQNVNKTLEWEFGAVTGNDLSSRSAVEPFKDDINVGLFTKDDFLGGQTHLGIASGDMAIFRFSYTGTCAGLDPFLARFQGVVLDGAAKESSDIATPTPLPGAIWLLGSGLGFLALLRRGLGL